MAFVFEMLKRLGNALSKRNALYVTVRSKILSTSFPIVTKETQIPVKPFIDVVPTSSTDNLVEYFSNQVYAKDYFGDVRVDNTTIIEFIKQNNITS